MSLYMKSFPMMENILGTIVIGGSLIVGYKTVTYIISIINGYIFDNCYLYKNRYHDQRVALVRSFRGCVEAVLAIFKSCPRAFRVVGMDCEMTSTSVNGGHPVPAVLQLASPEGYCAIFQLKVMESAKEDRKICVPYLSECLKISVFKPQSDNILRQILEDPSVLKVGVAVINDARYLAESYGLISKGCLDIRFLAKSAGVQPKSLAYLAKEVLGKEKVEINKKHKQPWESDRLNKHQIRYATEDAHLGVEIFLKLNEKVIERSYSWLRRLTWDEKTYWKYSMKLWKDYIGKPFEISAPVSFVESKSWLSYIPRSSIMDRAGCYFMFESYNTVTSRRQLKAFGAPEEMFPRSCCVCGIPEIDSFNNIVLKAMVPVDYSIDFEDDNLYYICLCSDCSEETRTKVDYELRQELTEECGAPHPDYADHRLVTAQKLAREFISSCDGLRTEWSHILLSKLHQLLPKLNDHEFRIISLEVILSMDCWPESEHGQFVHDYFLTYGGGLEELRWRWCAKFWEVMRPQNLPHDWKAFYQHERFLYGRVQEGSILS